MAAAVTTKTAKDGASTPATFPMGFLDVSGTGAGPFVPLHALYDSTGALINPATKEGVAALATAYGAAGDAPTPDITANGASFTFVSLFKGMVANLLALTKQLPASLGVKAAAASLPVVLASDQATLPVDTVVRSTATNRSGTITTGGSAQVLMPANAARRGFRIQNQSSGVLYFSGTGAATADQNSFLLNPGDYYESSTHFIGTAAVSILGATTGQAFHATEF